MITLYKFQLSIIMSLMMPGLVCAQEVFTSEISSIPPQIKELMTGHSWHEGCPLGLDQLAYLKMSYWGFDNKAHQGELIVYKDIAQNTVETFKALFAIKFPIESMQLPERFPKEASLLKDNNTSAFYCRMDEQTTNKFSPHSYGIAIDINNVYNPAIIAEGKVSPESGRKYLNRALQHKGMIRENDAVFQIFTERGWYWGGYFPSGVDYQHFQKLIIKHYLVTGFKYLTPKEQIMAYGLTNNRR
jgi:hypothetical protein